MPDTQFGSGSIFDEYRSQLSGWLRAYLEEVRPLSPSAIGLYNDKGKCIVAGWEVKLPTPDVSLRVLLDNAFPFAHIKIAYMGECQYLSWPHVEENGFLCLPASGWRPIDNLAFSIQERLNSALKLLDDCQSEEYVKSESAKEFLSYWGRSDPSKAKALSLINLSSQTPRPVAAVMTDSCWLAGEDRETLNKWVEKQGRASPSRSAQALFGYVAAPPSLPLPKNTKQFLKWMLDQCPKMSSLIEQLSLSEEAFIFLAVGRGGPSLIGVRLSPVKKNGFRKPSRNCRVNHLPARRIQAAWACFSQLTFVRVERADGEWIHGRGLDPQHQLLASRQVVVLGGGSLGSQVAARLAQAGVGHITIVDPESLATSNVGRHALGMDNVLKSKAVQLANTLSQKYPHGNFQGILGPFQTTLHQDPEVFRRADLVVSCIAEIDQDLSWDSWHRSESLVAPTVYGWLGTEGTTGHALALTAGGPGLTCYFDTDGFIRNPSTHFRDDSQIKVEPGCGTEFQPYGPLAAGHVELLVTRLSLDILTGKISSPHHRIYACASDDLRALGGQWTDEHKRHRPIGYDGPFEYNLPVTHCGACYKCQAQ
tara:strand:- start:19251 stop:21029 length:1779 start_codon:yes stop_codon:yes gene_type:complete